MTNRILRRQQTGKSRAAARLSPELERALSSYTSAALAAGVGLMAIAKSAQAKIVYTPAKVPIPVDGGAVFLDLNHDGVADFVLSNFFQYATESRASVASLLVSASGVMPNQVWGQGVGTNYGQKRFAWALKAGYSVRADKSRFHKSPTALMERQVVAWNPWDRPAKTYYYCSTWPPGCRSYRSGQWLYTKSRYLGLKFVIKGEIHYGWARATVSRTSKRRGDNSITATLTGYAYETVSNKPIITGKTKGPEVNTMPLDVMPHTLGRLAAGRK